MTYKRNFTQTQDPPEYSEPVRKTPSDKKWWMPVWNGLLSADHYRRMRSSLWIYMYFLAHANRYSGRLFRKISTVAGDMGISERTVSRRIRTLKQNRYIETEHKGHSLHIQITKWKPIKKSKQNVTDKKHLTNTDRIIDE